MKTLGMNMPRLNRKLTELEIRNAKPKDRDYKLYDVGGLRLYVHRTGTKVWQYPYKHNGKWNIYTIGKHGDISTVEARTSRDTARKLLDEGIDPNGEKKTTRIKRDYENRNSFEAIAREWYSKQDWTEKHAANVLSRLEIDVFPVLGRLAISKVSRQEVLRVLQNIEERGALDVAKRMSQYCTCIFDYALTKGLCESNPSTGLSKILKATKVKHRAYLKEAQLPEFLEALEQYRGGRLVKLAMKLLMLTFVRPGELLGARWEEFDFSKSEWRIPAQRMKMKREHIVPLSPQALAVIEEIKEMTGNAEILFPGNRNIRKPISDVTLIKCLIILGYGGKATPHGMRSTASTILNERKYRGDVIERQLAHIESNKIRKAYNRAEYLDERREMMNWYGSYLQDLGMGIGNG